MAKKKKPTTKPTGFVPPTAKRVSEVVKAGTDHGETLKAWRVKAIYVQERSRFETMKAGESVPYVPPRVYDGRAAITVEGELELEKMRASVWQQLVDWCKARKINPEAYVRECFNNIPFAHKTAPEPRQLMGDKFLERWKKSKPKRRQEIKLSLQIQRDTARRNLVVRQKVLGEAAEFAQIGVFADGRALGLSPLFCYCLATSIGTRKLRRVATRLKAEAVLQFETARGLYKRYWAELLPEGFAAESKAIYPYLLAKLWVRQKKRKTSD
jgi:hypothetical protein